jgi:hypothetical protein
MTIGNAGAVDRRRKPFAADQPLLQENVWQYIRQVQQQSAMLRSVSALMFPVRE